MESLVVLLIGALLWIIPLWVICGKVGMSPAISLIAVIPLFGSVVVLAVLAFARWPNARVRES
jgi:hypothetical protein